MKLTSDYVIFLAYDGESIVYAAQKLQEYIRRACSFELPIRRSEERRVGKECL